MIDVVSMIIISGFLVLKACLVENNLLKNGYITA
jgi:hypothetical protein